MNKEIDWDYPLEVSRNFYKDNNNLFYLLAKTKDENYFYVIATYNVKNDILRVNYAENIVEHLKNSALCEFIEISKSRYNNIIKAKGE